jgi:prevent-host-death family protein
VDTYSIYDAKAHLSAIIRAVKRRRSVTITERGVPVAQVVPYRGTGRPTLDERLAELGARGVLSRPPRVRPVDALRPVTPRRAGALSRFLADRE